MYEPESGFMWREVMQQDYMELFDKVGREKFESRFTELLKEINAFLHQAQYDGNVVCNERILYHVLLDYYSDILRLKEFHDIKYAKTDKVIAYLIYWIIRRKPIQLKEFSDTEKDIYVNERFACTLLLSECLLNNSDKNLTKEQAQKFDKYVDLLLYYFKYRQVNPQVIELVIESFKIGKFFS